MPLHALSVPPGPNQFFSAASLSLLLPTLSDEAIFDDAVEHLFGTIAGRFQRILLSELKSHTIDSMPPSLNGFINSHLRPKLADYIVANKADYLALFDSEASLMAAVDKVRSGAEFLGALEEAALARMMNTTLVKHASEVVAPSPALDASTSVHLVVSGKNYQLLLNPERLMEPLRRQLFPLLLTPSTGASIVDVNTLKRAELKRILMVTLRDIPMHLEALAKTMPTVIRTSDPFKSEDPTDLKYSLRSDVFRESVIVAHSELSRVPLRKDYELCEISSSSSDEALDKYRLYVRLKETGFDYQVRRPSDLMERGSMAYSELSSTLHAPVELEHLRPFVPTILAKIGKDKLFPIESALIGDASSWGMSLAAGGAAGVTVGSIGVLATALAGGIAAIPVVGLPVAGTTLLVILGVSIFGKQFAVQYERVLDTVRGQLSERKFKEASEALDVEFGRFAVTRAFRSLFLTQQHHALAHFFRGMCAEGLDKHAEAFFEYQKAFAAAEKGAASLTILVTQLQMLKLLRKSDAPEFPHISKPEEMDRLLRSLSKDYSNGLARFYWKSHNTMLFMAKRCVTMDGLDEEDCHLANRFLQAKGFFILKHFADDRGAFVEVFSAFFQGIILTYFEHSDPAYLERGIIPGLISEPIPGKAPEAYTVMNLATQKFAECARLLRSFKTTHAALIGRHPPIALGIKFIENFMIYYHLLSVHDRRLSIDDITALLPVERAQVALLSSEVSASLGFITKLKQDFGVPYETAEAWLAALLKEPSHEVSLVSKETGNTMLHALASLPKPQSAALEASVKKVAQKLKSYGYVRNRRGETPLVLMPLSDPYELRPIIDSEPYVKVGTALDQVEAFVKRIQTTPLDDGHFLLLEGLPGTGKTSAVTTYLKHLGFLVETLDPSGGIAALTTGFSAAVDKPAPEGKLRVIFIDNLEKVFPRQVPHRDLLKTLGEMEAFEKQMAHLAGKRVVLIGATRAAELVSELIVLKAGRHRVLFELPDASQRLQLLTYFFRKKRIDASAIEALAAVANNYSAGQLYDFVNDLTEGTVTLELLKTRFNYYAKRLSQYIQGEVACLHLTMPSFERASELAGLSLPNEVLEIQLAKLKRNVSRGPAPPHILLRGPSDSGKKTAIRLLAEQSGRALVTLNDDEDLDPSSLRAFFKRAKTLGRVIIFIDEMEKWVSKDSRIAKFLQREMAGFSGCDVIVVGIIPMTMDLKNIDSELLQIFNLVSLMALGIRERGQGMRKLLIESEKAHPGKLCFDEELREALVSDVTPLGEATQGLPFRKAHTAMVQLIAELMHRQALRGSGVVYLRLQDVQTYMGCLIRTVDSGVAILSDYIDTSKTSLFQESVPAAISKLVLASSPPTSDILRTRPLSCTAYVRVRHETRNQLFFIDREGCIELGLSAARLSEFDSSMELTVEGKALSTQERSLITRMTGHSLIKTVFSVDVLEVLRRDFSLRFDSVDAWLTALLAPGSRLGESISSEGDTMLHVLVKVISADEAVVEKIKKGVASLIHFRYARNHRHETPMLALELADPYRMKNILSKEAIIKIGDSLDGVEAFLERITAHPEIDSHFLLLDGPPGTGKTSAVLSYLRANGYAVTEWVRGTGDDKVVGGLVTRIGSFFEEAKRKALSGTLQLLFIDEIDAVIPLVSGTPLAGHHNQYEVVTAFQAAITSLAGQRVVLIGATNYPQQLPKPIIERAGTNRIYFPLPDERQRQALLEHLLMHKEIEPSCIARLAAVSTGYSPRQLRSFVDTIKEKRVTSALMIAYFNAYADTLRGDFKAEFSCAELFMPSFEKEGEVESLFSSNPELREQLRRLQSRTAADPRMHTLLYGPPGGGKTTAVRVFAQKSGQVLLSIRADVRTSAEVLAKLFSRAKQFGRAIIFFDEMDRVACSGSPHTGFLQTEMDGMIANELTIIGATNYQERFEAAISSRFTSKILMPTLTRAQLGKPIRASLLDGVRTYGAPMYFDGELAAAMAEDSTRLGDEGSGLDLRSVHATLAYLMGDLTRERGSHAGITYLRLQDVCFAFYRMKIQEGLVARPAAGVPTSMVYIQTHRHSLFPAGALPEGSVDVSSGMALG